MLGDSRWLIQDYSPEPSRARGPNCNPMWTRPTTRISAKKAMPIFPGLLGIFASRSVGPEIDASLGAAEAIYPFFKKTKALGQLCHF